MSDSIESPKHPGGRPSEYTQEKLELARAYENGGWEIEGDAIPQVVGLALAMGLGKTTLYEWAKDPDKQEFRDILTRVLQAQERKLINGGLSSAFNPVITKMMMTKHGYSDKQELDISSADGSMTPKPGLDVSKLSPQAIRELMAAKPDDSDNG